MGLVENKKNNALVLFGSPHKNGFTATTLNMLLKDLNNYNFLVINAYKENILPCIDCGICKNEHKCKFDDFNKIDKFISLSDLIIIAFPIYNGGVPSPLKAIFDRMQRYFYFRHNKNNLKNKKAILILTCGSSNKSQKEVIEQQLTQILNLINAKLEYTILWSNTDNCNDLFCVEDEIKKVLLELNTK